MGIKIELPDAGKKQLITVFNKEKDRIATVVSPNKFQVGLSHPDFENGITIYGGTFLPLTSATPVDTTYCLYNVTGALYWNGSVVSTGSHTPAASGGGSDVGWKADGDEKIYTTGSLGVGATPATTLYVKAEDARVRVDSDPDGQPGFELSRTGTRKWVIYDHETSDNLDFKTNTDIRMSIEQDGNVGIGVTDPTQKLHVDGNILQTTGDYLATDKVRAIDGDGLSLFDDDDKGIFIEDGGNVGINTASPDTQLEISKDSADAELTISAYHDTEATTPKITFRKADNTAASPALVDNDAVLGTLSFQGYDGSGFEEGARIEVRVSGSPSDGSDMPTEISFWTTPNSSATAVQRMTIQSDGDVGIGTLSPSRLLHIQTDATTGTSPIEIMRLEVRDTNDVALAVGEGPAIDFWIAVDEGSDTSDPGGRIAVVRESTTDASSDARMSLYTSPNDGSLTERVRIDSAGGVDVLNQNPFRRSSGRYYLEEFFSKRPQANGSIGGYWASAAVRACNQHFELLGTNSTNNQVDWAGGAAGLLLTTNTSDNSQVIILPHLDVGADSQYDSAWSGVFWGTENQVEWETAIMTTTAITNRGYWAGLKESNTSTIATDDDQAYFTYCADDTFGTLDDNANWHFVYSIDDTDYITDLGLAAETTTIYRLRINIDSSRQVSVFINDTQYGLTQTGGTTGTTESDSTQKSLALTDDKNLIPYVGVQTLTQTPDARSNVYLFYEKISRILYE